MSAALEQLVDDREVDAIAARSVPLPDEQSLKLSLGPLDHPIPERSSSSPPAGSTFMDDALARLDALDARRPEARPTATVPPLPPGPRPRVPPPLPMRARSFEDTPPAGAEPLPSFPLSDPPGARVPANDTRTPSRAPAPAPPSPTSRTTATAGWLLLVGAGIVGGYVVGLNRVAPQVSASSGAAAARIPEAPRIAADAASVEPHPRVDERPSAPEASATVAAAPSASAPTTAAAVPAPIAAAPFPPVLEEEPPPSRPSGPDTAAMSAALASAAAGAASCPGDPNQPDASVGITFGPSGDATVASVSAPASATACVTQAFSGLHVPPFLGVAVTAYKSFRLASR